MEEEEEEEEEHLVYIKNNQRDKSGSIAKGLVLASQRIVFCKQTLLRVLSGGGSNTSKCVNL